MKVFQAFFVSIVLSISVKAEYNSFHFTFEIYTDQGETITGYNSVAEHYWRADSISNQQFLMRVLGFSTATSDDTFYYFQDRITYNYQYPNDSSNQEYQVHQLISLKGIGKNQIQQILIKNQLSSTYSLGIFNELEISDQGWVSSKPISTVNYFTYLCDYLICVHAETPVTRDVLKKLLELSEQYNGENVSEDDLEIYQDKFEKILIQLKNEKVVIVAGCTC